MKTVYALISLLLLSAAAMAQSVDSVWVKRFNSPLSGADQYPKIAIDDSGNVIITGRSYQGAGVGTGYDWMTVKYNSGGDTLWARKYTGFSNGQDWPREIVTDPGGNIYVAGSSEASGANTGGVIIKYNSDGDSLWVERFDGEAALYDAFYDVFTDINGFVYVAGVSESTTNYWNYLTVKYDSLGNQEWARIYSGAGYGTDWAHAVAVDANGNVYVTGESQQSSTDIVTVKYLPNGSQDWVSIYDGPVGGFDGGFDILIDGNNFVYVCGSSDGSGSSRDIILLKYQPDGDTVWTRRWNGVGNGQDNCYSMAITGTTGPVTLAGVSYGGVGSQNDIVAIRYNSLGQTVYEKLVNGSDNLNDAGISVAADNDGNAYIVGEISHAPYVDNYAMKISPVGMTGWARAYDGESFNDYGSDVACDNWGNVYTVGYSLFSGTDYDFVLQRFSILGPLVIYAYSPVNLKVTDPAGYFIGKDEFGVLSQTLFPANYYEEPPDFIDSVVIYFPIIGTYIIEIIPEQDAPPGSTYSVGIRIDGSVQSVMIQDEAVPATGTTDTYYYTAGEEEHFINGDANGNKVVNILDVTYILAYLYKHGPEPVPLVSADAQCNGVVNILDATYLISSLYKGGPDPCQGP